MLDNTIFYTGVKPVKLKKWNKVDNSIPVYEQAKLYAAWIQEQGKTDLWFFPLTKSPNGHANQFRMYVLNLLTGHSRPDYVAYGWIESKWLLNIERHAIAKGYTINIYRPE